MHLIRALSTTFLVAASALPQPGMAVLCIAPGAHVSIEAGQERCTVPADPGERDASECAVGFAQPEGCCSPCTDLPLGSSVFIRGSGSKDDVQPLNPPTRLAAAVTSRVREPRVGEGDCTASRRHAASLSKPVFQTVVLRC